MSVHEFLNLIIRNKKIILRYTIIFCILLFLILYFVYPVSYKASVIILPPEKDKELGGLGSLLTGQDFGSLITGSSGSANSQLFAEMLKSRTAAEYVISKHNLMSYYSAKTLQQAADKIRKDIDVEVTKEGIIKLNLEVRSSWMPMAFDRTDTLKFFSAGLTNSFVEALDKINREKLSSKAKKAREYIEQQLITTRYLLDSAETALMEFQKVNKTISLPEQVQAAIDAAAGLKTEIIKTEMELGFLGSNLREDNKNLIALKERLNELQTQYSKMEMGNKDYLLAFREVPELGKKLATLVREVKIRNEIYLLLQQQFYKEKIQETRDLPTVEVLDKAIPPDKASGPRVLFATFMGGIFMFLLMSLIVFMKEKNILRYRVKNG